MVTYIYMSFKTKDDTVQKEKKIRWDMQMGGVRRGRKAYYKKIVCATKKSWSNEARLAKESGDRRSSVRRQEPCRRAADRIAIIRGGEQDVAVAHPGHRAG